MQRAEVVLGALGKNAEREGFVFTRLYRHLYNEDWYREADVSKEELRELIAQLKKERYAPRQGKGTVTDALVEDAICRLLGAIYPETTHDGRCQWLKVKQAASRRWALWCRWGVPPFTLKKHHLERVLAQRIGDGRFLALALAIYQARKGRGRMAGALERMYQCWLGRSFVPLSPTTEHFVAGAESLLLGSDGTSMEQEEEHLSGFLVGEGLEVTAHKQVADVRLEAVRLADYAVKAKADGCLLLVPGELVRAQRQPFTRFGRPVARDERLYLPVYRILEMYREELGEMVERFSLADNLRPKLGDFHYYHYSSLLRTLAKKDRLSLKEVARKYWATLDGGREGLGAEGPGTLAFYPARVRHLFSA